MKMNYHSRDKVRKNGGRFSSLSIVSVLFLLLILFALVFRSPFSALVQTIGRPIWEVKNSLGQSNFFANFSSKKKLAAENRDLNNRLDELQNTLTENQVLTSENASLKEVLGRKSPSSKLILATILTRPPQSPYDTVIVDVGQNNGVKAGETVLAMGDLAVGKVAEVHSQSATIRLFSAPNEKSQVTIVGTTTLAATAEGYGGGNFEISLPAGTPVNIGDAVILPGLSPILLGKVEKTETKPNDSFMTVYFKAPINIANLTYLQIVSE